MDAAFVSFRIDAAGQKLIVSGGPGAVAGAVGTAVYDCAWRVARAAGLVLSHTMWMSQPCRWSCMNVAFTPYDPVLA
jgi:hypothetical protein